jgi:glycosyltransferase involved in cell wall biosynthesis
MKIGIDIRCLMEPHYSGISEYTYNLLDQLFRIDDKNQYFLFYNTTRAINLPDFKYPNVIFKGFRYPNKIFNLALRFLKIAAIDKLIGGVDVFLIPNFLFLNLSGDCKKILIVHDLSFDLYPQFFTFKRRLWHKLIGPKDLCRSADLVIAISENTKNDIIRLYGLDPKKIKVIYPGISPSFFQNIDPGEKQRIRDKYNLPEHFVFYLGNLEPRKNVESLILAFGQVKDESLSLVIAGSHAWKYKNIYKIWQNSPAKKRIKFLGYVDSADKPALYAAASMFVYPSIYEGFGLPPVEAMACGTPVISSFNSSLVESVATAGLLIDPNNLSDIARAIDQLMADQALKDSLIAQGRIQSSKFRWEDAARDILDQINHLTS